MSEPIFQRKTDTAARLLGLGFLTSGAAMGHLASMRQLAHRLFLGSQHFGFVAEDLGIRIDADGDHQLAG